MDLINPQSFNEKIQWLKIHDRNPEYTKMVDKYGAKEYVKKILGEKYIIPTIGVWDDFKDIDFDILPNQFVLKCTHDSGGLVICRDKKSFSIAQAKKNITKSLKREFWQTFREWAYKDVKPRIIAETYMEDKKSKTLVDYKFFCFNGSPKLLYVSEGLENHSTARISFFDLEGKRLPFYRNGFQPFDDDIFLPETYDEMLQCADKLAKAVASPFVRIDLYEINRKVYFSEITFYPNGGYIPFEPHEWDKKLGDLLII